MKKIGRAKENSAFLYSPKQIQDNQQCERKSCLALEQLKKRDILLRDLLKQISVPCYNISWKKEQRSAVLPIASVIPGAKWLTGQ